MNIFVKGKRSRPQTEQFASIIQNNVLELACYLKFAIWPGYWLLYCKNGDHCTHLHPQIYNVIDCYNFFASCDCYEMSVDRIEIGCFNVKC